jgi:DNA mismatch repair protein MutS
MLRQYFDIKQTVGDAILFFRMGDFFEIFGDDAELIAPKLDIVLTAREKGDQTKIPFCGVPHHSAKGYWLKLVKLGYKVAICEQLEDSAKATGLVRRGVTRVYSPGSIDELEGLEQELPNYLLAWMDIPGSESEVLAAVDVSTGEFRLGNIEKGQLPRYVRQFRPSELLVRRFALPMVTRSLESWTRENQLRMDEIPESPLKDESAQRGILADVFGHADISRQPGGLVMGGGALASAVIQYLRDLKSSTSQFMRIDLLEEPDSIALSESVIRDLEIFETSRRRQSDGSLIRVIDRTLSPMGARALRYAISHPLTKVDAVALRHRAVGDLVTAGEGELGLIRQELRHAPDLARLATRILTGSASPHELAMARNALCKANALSPKILALAAGNSRLETLAAELVAAGDVLAI